ncbi:dihydroorotase [Thermosynechococcus sp. JY1334]|uniref:dihydroorotase n=1 Tax=unclassified Thermosynechococcus TaxID=2622553 RepID=UPI002671DDB9|nr:MULTISPECIES: dihydroorotase [unclassified Thermosynechococcus]MDR7897419.1 dihydroorotase [Thermosynechococcus sp. JY1332]MDR7904824.1 dihydroorotase [Thermosynechococcus sp. JY1334]WKT87049.1 dihydroorotase [Thermosynechococcus sp. JY1339]WNC55992.1 dihydroorotase [Thermosynechococcus sp. JY1331]
MVWRLLQQVRLLDPVNRQDYRADVLLAADQLVAIAPQEVPADAEIIDASEWVLAPPLVDLYSHSGQPGYEARETLETLLAAAAAGGVQHLTLLPTTNPVIDDPALWQGLQRQIPTTAWSQVRAWGALTQGCQGTALTDLAELAASGVVGFCDDRGLTHWPLVQRALTYVQPLGKPVALWPFDPALAANGVARQSGVATRLGLVEQLVCCETIPLLAILELARTVSTSIHLMRLSTARSVEILAKDKPEQVSASVSWLHLLFTVEDLASYDPHLRLDPPLGTASDRQALIEGLKTGVIEAIAIDHTPLLYEEKMVSFAEALPGAIGLELALPALWQELVAKEYLSALDLWHALSTAPARILSIEPPRLELHSRNFVLFDPTVTWTVTHQSLRSRARNTPFWQHSLRGQLVSFSPSINSGRTH